VTMKTTKRTI